MGGCCGLNMIEINGKLCCAQCNLPVTSKKNQGAHRCEVLYKCNLCGKERYVKCGTKFKVQVSGVAGDKMVVAK